MNQLTEADACAANRLICAAAGIVAIAASIAWRLLCA